MKRVVFLLFPFFILLISSCTTFQSEGFLSVEDQRSFVYKHAAISPETDNSVRGSLAQVLRNKGFIVYQTTAFRNVVGIKRGNPVIVFVCNDAGRTDSKAPFLVAGSFGISSNTFCNGNRIFWRDIFRIVCRRFYYSYFSPFWF